MTIYVESNFVLELALGQEQADAAEDIVRRAERGEIELAFPAFSLSEPFATVAQRAKARSGVAKSLDEHRRELARSSPHRGDLGPLEAVPAVLAEIGRRELSMLAATMGRMLEAGTPLQLDRAVFQEAIRVQDRHGFTVQDGIVYASILAHLSSNTASTRHYFANKNWKDFRTPSILAELNALGCEYLSSFDEAALLLAQSPP
jgi:predicted nucleic acid-binding protein